MTLLFDQHVAGCLLQDKDFPPILALDKQL